ncbi:MAG: ABC transporter substrate-binding protein, partial [Gelidibacter sp.]
MSNFRRFFYPFFLLFSITLCSQDYTDLWEGHFSYLDIRDVTNDGNIIYAASENSIFSVDSETNQIETITTINGLSGETISTIYYSQNYGLLLIGYENGLIEIVSDISTKILSVIDILNKSTIPS